ncbi:LLM class F420-dependent oxidoreductase [Nonomuraea sp. MTCD27]|uniref:LLM class F420-dependent oxidoreductase n=1 Tax=Nonomuraea sp. MTCD27 TaxID=1676747 RepID=UPI0035BFB73B
MDLSGVGVWSHHLRYGDPGEAADAAAELEELGFRALWFPDAGGPVFDAVTNLLTATREIVVATGILNLWMHEPAGVAAAYASVSATYAGRFLMGIGVSHAVAINTDQEPARYRRPMEAMRAFLDELDQADQPVPTANRVLAALGPKMLDLAAKRARGAHPYLVTPEHTRRARAALGDGPLLLPEQTVILCRDRQEARAIGDGWLRSYLALPNYANNLLRLGYSPEELASVSDRLFDDVIAWGNEEAILRRLDEHRAAGADHVCVQVVTADSNVLPRREWRLLAAALR